MGWMARAASTSRLAVVGMMVVVLGSVRATVNDNHDMVCWPLPTLTFGQSLPLTGSWAMNGLEYAQGIQAAMNEYNQQTGSRSFRLELQVLDDQYDPAVARANVASFVSNDSILGILGMAGTASVESATPIAAQKGIPVFAVYGGLALRHPFQKHLINFRASYFDESAALVGLLVAKARKRIAVWMQNDAFGTTGLQGVLAALASSNIYLHSVATYTRNANESLLQGEIDASLQVMGQQSSAPPDAIVLIAAYAPAISFIAKARAKWPSVYLGCLSPCSPSVVLEALAENATDSNVLTNIFFSQVVPLPTNTTIAIVQKYSQAMSNIGVQTVSFASLETYIMTRLAIAALARIEDHNYTQTALLKAIYDTSYFNMDGFRCGPLNPEEIDGGCNQCMHQVLLTVSTTNRTIMPVDGMDPYFHFSTCGYQPKQWQVLRFGMSCSFNGSQSNHCSGFRDGLRAAFKKVNDAGGIRGTTKLMLDTSDDGENKVTALLSNADYLQNDSYFGLVGTSDVAVDALVPQLVQSRKVMIGAFTGDLSIRTPFVRNVVNFRASMSDEMFAIVHHCLYQKGLQKVAVLYEATPFGQSCRNQLETALGEKRRSIWSEASYAGNQMSGSVDQLFSGHGADLEAVVFAGLGDEFVDAAMAIHSVRSSVVIFGLSLTVASALSDPEVQQRVNLNNIFVTQCAPDITDTSTLVGVEYQAALSEIDDQLVPSPFGLEGFLVGQLVATSLNRILGHDLTVDNMLDAIYENGNFNLYGLRCGPLEENASTSSRTSCNQCMKKVYITSFTNVTQRVDSTFSFEDECMYTPHTNVDFQLGGSRMIMVVLAACGIGYTVLVMSLLILYRNSPQVRVTSYRFSLISCFGAIVCFCGVFVLYPIPTDLTCALRPWVSDVGFVTLFGPIFAKTFRIDKLFNNRKKMQRKIISDQQIFRLVVALLGVEAIFLGVFMAVDAPHMDEAFTALGERYEICTNKFNTFTYVDYGMKALVLLWGCFLCQRVYKISGRFARFNESKKLVVCIYHTTFVAIAALLVGVTTKDNPNLFFVSFSALLILNTVVVVTVLYARRVKLAIEDRPMVDDEDTDASNSNSNPQKPLAPLITSSAGRKEESTGRPISRNHSFTFGGKTSLMRNHAIVPLESTQEERGPTVAATLSASAVARGFHVSAPNPHQSEQSERSEAN